MKNMRVYKGYVICQPSFFYNMNSEKGTEKVVALPTGRTVFVILNTADGSELAYSGDAIDR